MRGCIYGEEGEVFLISIVMLVLVFGLVYAGITLTSNFGKSSTQVTTENAGKELGKLYADIAPATAKPVKGQIDLDPVDVADSLPDISKFPITVENTTNEYVEIFSSIEKSGTGADGWLTEVSEEFNKANITVGGQPVSVKSGILLPVRQPITSSLANTCLMHTRRPMNCGARWLPQAV